MQTVPTPVPTADTPSTPRRPARICPLCDQVVEQPQGRGRGRDTHESCGNAVGYLAAFEREISAVSPDLPAKARARLRSRVQSLVNAALNVAGPSQKHREKAQQPGCSRFGGSRSKSK